MRVLGGGLSKPLFRGLAEATRGLPTRAGAAKCGRCTGEPQRVSLVAQSREQVASVLPRRVGRVRISEKLLQDHSRDGAPMADRSQTDNLDAGRVCRRGCHVYAAIGAPLPFGAYGRV